MFGELSWNFFDRLAAHYGAAKSHVDRVDSLAMQLSEVCSNLEHRTPSMLDLSGFFSPRTDRAQEAVRAAAWLGQHVFGARCWSVGQKVIEMPNRGRAHSPYIRQLEALGHSVDEISVLKINEFWNSLGFPRASKIDAMFRHAETREVTLVKAQLASQAKRLGGFRLLKRKERGTLFGDDKAFIIEHYCKSESLAALVFAGDVVRAAVKDIKCRLIFATIEDPTAGGKFQMHLIPPGWTSSLNQARTKLDDFSVHSTHEDFPQISDEPHALLELPKWSEPDYLHKSPIDLPVRSIMIVKWMLNQQAHVAKRLCMRTPREIAVAVAKEYRLHYPENMARHDIDRLQQIGLLEKSPTGTAALALTPAGVFRGHVLNHRFNRLLPNSPASMLESIERQAQLWLDESKVG